MWDLVGKSEDRFSHNEAQVTVVCHQSISCIEKKLILCYAEEGPACYWKDIDLEFNILKINVLEKSETQTAFYYLLHVKIKLF